MDVNLVREALTVAAFIGFVAIVWWAYAPSRKAQWQAKAILDEDQA